jgi:hypothetical protein
MLCTKDFPLYSIIAPITEIVVAPSFDPFKILGIGQDATDEEVKRAYRAKASKYHPDAGGDVWVFQQVQAAYESVLNQRAKAAASSRKSNAAKHRSETSPQSPSDDGCNATRHPGPEQTKSKRSDPQEVEVGGSSAPSMSSKRSRPKSEGPNKPETQKAARNSGHGLWQVFFGHLPLQNETCVFILVNVLDIFATYALLRFGGLEANPIADYFFRRWNVKGMVVFKMAIVALVAILAQIIARRNLARASQVLILGTVIVTAVVLYSIYLLARRL